MHKNSRMGSGKTHKLRGHNGERYYATFFQNLGFPCETSRAASRKHDNAKIDLMYIPFNIQIKTGKHTAMNPGKELFNMEAAMMSMFPKEDEVFTRPRLLIHRMFIEKGQKRSEHHDLVYMSYKQFLEFNSKGSKLVYITHKEYKYELDSDFKHMISVTMEAFKNEVILKQYRNVNNSNSTTGTRV